MFEVTILILIDGFLQYEMLDNAVLFGFKVTILILIDGFLQFLGGIMMERRKIASQSLF